MLKGRRFSPAMIVAMIALAVALSGTAVAGTTKLITGSQIANGTIKLADMHSSVKTALKGQTGATGAQGPAGAQGARGRSGRRAPPARRATGSLATRRLLRAGHAPLRLHQGRRLPRRGLGRHRHRGMRRRPGCQPDQGRDRRWRAVPQRRPQRGHDPEPLRRRDAHHRLLPRPHGLGHQQAEGQPARRLDRPAQHHPVRGHASLGDLCGRASHVVTPSTSAARPAARVAGCFRHRARANKSHSMEVGRAGVASTRPFCYPQARSFQDRAVNRTTRSARVTPSRRFTRFGRSGG